MVEEGLSVPKPDSSSRDPNRQPSNPPLPNQLPKLDNHPLEERVMISSDSSRASSPALTPKVTTSIPHNVQEALRAWFSRYGFAHVPPCAVRNYGTALFDSDSVGAPVVYSFQSSIQFQVQPFRVTNVSQTQTAGHQPDATLLVASHPTHVSIMIGQPSGPAYEENFRIWEGITATDPNGWSSEEVYTGSSSRKKSLDLIMFRGP